MKGARLLPHVRAAVGALVVVALLAASAVALPSVHGISSKIGPLFPTRVSHVIVIVFENSEAANVLSKGSFFHYLANHYAYVASDYAICHPSAPNYLALTSGATYSQCGTDTHHLFSVTNVADRLESKKLTWGTFQESMPKACDLSNSYPYAVKHNPFVFYTDIANNASRCGSHVLSLNAWTQDVNTSKIPNYSFITPNLKNDGHDTNVSYASSWLHGFLTPLVNKSWFASSVFFIVYDEGTTNLGAGTSSSGPTNSTGGGHIFLSIVGPNSVGKGNLSNLSSHYSVLTTVEWLLGLTSTGHNDKTSSWPALKSAFL